MFTKNQTPTKSYCNCLAQERGLNPVGHAGDFDDAVIIEVPLPWKRDMMQESGALPQEMIDLLAVWLQNYYAGEGYPHRPLVVAPDADYTRQGFRQVMFFTKPEGMHAAYEKVEYLVPEQELGGLIWSWYEDRAQLPRFEEYIVHGAEKVRDILVCTHGTIDAACAKFGYPLYKHIRETLADATVHVWRVSHFGGHVFAPTLMDMPIGHYWAYVGDEQADRIIKRDGDVANMRGYYRGLASIGDGFMQTAECELWQRFGWEWFDYLKSGEIVAHDDEQKWADVRISYASPDGQVHGDVEMRVEIVRTIETEHTSGNPNVHTYPQYRVVM